MKNLYTSMMALACAGTMLAASPAPKSDFLREAFPELAPVAKSVTSTLSKHNAEKARVPFVKDFKPAAGAQMSRANSRATGTTIDWDTLDPASLEYVPIGEGYFYEACFTGLEIKTPVYEAKDYPGVYRYDKVWEPMAGEDAKPLYIDCTDPTFVYVPLQETGLVSTTQGELWVMSQAEYIKGNNPSISMSDIYDILVEEGINISVEDDVMIYMPAASLVGFFPDALDQTQAFMAMNPEEMYALIPLEGYQLIPQWNENVYEGSILNAMVLGGLSNQNGPIPTTEQACGIQYNNWYEGVFRVLSPYQDLGITGGSMEVVMSDPECVLVGYQPTGILIGDNGELYIISRAPALYPSKEDFLASEDAIYNITYDAETNRVNFPAGAILFNFPELAGNEDSLYLSGAPAGWIQLPDNVGVKDIESDVIDTNAPKAYYNLQGVQVANPTAGQIYIVKQGSKVTKQVIR